MKVVGESEGFRKVLAMVEKVADTDSTVLFIGESGTGKSLLARYLHILSPRATAPFVTIRCAAIPSELLESELFGVEKGAYTGAYKSRPGKFELAHRGTVFLDEVGEMPLALQVKILDVIQEKKFERVGGTKTIAVDVRIVAATQKNLEQEVKAGKFREDLFYRLNVFPIKIPPLRERVKDIVPLARFFLERLGGRFGVEYVLTKEAEEVLLSYEWPGNVRELENVMERATILCGKGGRILPSHILVIKGGGAERPGKPILEAGSLKSTLRRVEREIIMSVLEEVGWNKRLAAKKLGLGYRTLFNRLKELGINDEDVGR